MDPERRLLQFEDGTSIWFAVHSGVEDIADLKRLIHENGGEVVDANSTAYADFFLMSACRSDAKQIIANAEEMGLVAIDESWLWKSNSLKQLHPWYSFQAGIPSKVNKDIRDTQTLVTYLARHKSFGGPDAIYSYMARKYPHRTSLQFQQLHEQNREAIDECVASLERQIDQVVARFFSPDDPRPSLNPPASVNSSRRRETYPLSPPAEPAPRSSTSRAPTQGSDPFRRGSLVPRGSERNYTQAGLHAAEQTNRQRLTSFQRALSTMTASSSAGGFMPFTPPRLDVGVDGHRSVSRVPNVVIPSSETPPPLKGESEAEASRRASVETMDEDPASPDADDTSAAGIDSLQPHSDPSVRSTPSLSNLLGSGSQSGGERAVSVIGSEVEDALRYEFDAMRAWHASHPVAMDTDMSEYWAAFREETNVGKGRSLRQWVQLDKMHWITVRRELPRGSLLSRIDLQDTTTQPEDDQPGRRKNPPRGKEGGKWMWVDLENGKQDYVWVPIAAVPREQPPLTRRKSHVFTAPRKRARTTQNE